MCARKRCRIPSIGHSPISWYQVILFLTTTYEVPARILASPYFKCSKWGVQNNSFARTINMQWRHTILARGYVVTGLISCKDISDECIIIYNLEMKRFIFLQLNGKYFLRTPYLMTHSIDGLYGNRKKS